MYAVATPPSVRPPGRPFFTRLTRGLPRRVGRPRAVPTAALAAFGCWVVSAGRPARLAAQGFTPGTTAGGVRAAPPSDSLTLTFADVRRLTISRNPSFLAARQETAVARGGLRQARLYQFNPTAAATVPGSAAQSAGGSSPTQLTLTQEVEIGGQRGLRVGAAGSGVARAVANVANTGRLTLADAGTAFYRALAAQRRLDVARTVLALNERLVGAVRTQLREGEVSALDANLAEVELGRARGRVLAARRAAGSATLDLTRQLGLAPSTAVRLVDDEEPTVAPVAAALAAPGDVTAIRQPGATLTATPVRAVAPLPPLDTLPPPLDADSLVALALARRPDLGASDAAIREAESLRALARRQAVPNLLLGVAVEQSRGYGSGNAATRVGPAVGLGLPLFNRNQGVVAQRAAEIEQARFQRQAVALAVRTDVTDAVRAYQIATTEVAVFATTVLEPARRNSALLETAFRAGKISLPSLLLLRNQLLDAELGYWDAWLAQHEARVRLDAATGTLALPTTLPPLPAAPSAATDPYGAPGARSTFTRTPR